MIFSMVYQMEEDVMFVIELDLFLIGTIKVPTHTKLILKLVYILDFSIEEFVPKQHVELVCVLFGNLATPPNIVRQHLLKNFFHPKVGKMIISETPA
jgi:hypothetical protein